MAGAQTTLRPDAFTGLQPRSLLTLDQRHAATVQEYFPLPQGPGRPLIMTPKCTAWMEQTYSTVDPKKKL